MKASLRVVSGWANQRDSNRSLGLGIIALVGGILVIPQAAAAFNDGNWISTGTDPGANGDVYAAVIDSSGNLYIGGNFTMVGGVAANRIAKWDGSSWSALGSGMGGGGPVDPPNVYALAVSGSNLYAGGNFTRAGDTNASYIAKWDGSSWNALGLGMGEDGYVRALAMLGTNLYAGGYFRSAGGIPANYIAKWNGITWSALGSGMNWVVQALAASGGVLYAGGNFTNAGGISANYIARWSLGRWSALGSGMGEGGYVSALVVSGSDVYAGGVFTTAGGSLANRIAKWNGSSWSPLGSGMGGEGPLGPFVSALAVSGRDLYAGGRFTTAGGVAASCIARWNGTSWANLGSGMGGTVYPSVLALSVSGCDLYAGGEFPTAGAKPSPYVARAYLEWPDLSIVRSDGEVTLSWPTSCKTFLLQQNANPISSDTWSNANYPLTTNGLTKSAMAPITPTNQFFRLIGN